RSAAGAAELIAQRIGDEFACLRILLELREGIASLQHVVLAEEKGRAVQIVRARSGRDRNDTGDGLAELSVIILRSDLGLADRLEVRIDDDDAQNRIAVLGSVQLITRAAEVLAVDHRLC